uniref:Small cell adhesion glycoprotein n=1 Tax=Leptobrachium leishanense TaxID=445787 RepID=A0A8C5LQM6_9ANUR
MRPKRVISLPPPPLHILGFSFFPLGVIAAVFITLVIAVALISVYLYKHKGSYITNELPEDESSKALQTEEGSSEKQEYMM